jgi:hypothetical protein
MEVSKNPEEAQPTKKAQYNFTDRESGMLKGSDGFGQGYNTQIAVEPVFQLIVGQRGDASGQRQTTDGAVGGGDRRTGGSMILTSYFFYPIPPF